MATVWSHPVTTLPVGTVSGAALTLQEWLKAHEGAPPSPLVARAADSMEIVVLREKAANAGNTAALNCILGLSFDTAAYTATADPRAVAGWFATTANTTRNRGPHPCAQMLADARFALAHCDPRKFAPWFDPAHSPAASDNQGLFALRNSVLDAAIVENDDFRDQIPAAYLGQLDDLDTDVVRRFILRVVAIAVLIMGQRFFVRDRRPAYVSVDEMEAIVADEPDGLSKRGIDLKWD